MSSHSAIHTLVVTSRYLWHCPRGRRISCALQIVCSSITAATQSEHTSSRMAPWTLCTTAASCGSLEITVRESAAGTWRAGGVSPLMMRSIRGLTPPARRYTPELPPLLFRRAWAQVQRFQGPEVVALTGLIARQADPENAFRPRIPIGCVHDECPL